MHNFYRKNMQINENFNNTVFILPKYKGHSNETWSMRRTLQNVRFSPRNCVYGGTIYWRAQLTRAQALTLHSDSVVSCQREGGHISHRPL